MIKYLISLILILFIFSCNELDLNNVSDVVENSTNKIEEIIDNTKLNLTFIIDESEKHYVERIDIFGNTNTYEEVLRNELLIDEGDGYNKILHNKSIANLKALGFFGKVTSEMLEGSTDNKKISEVANKFDVEVIQRPKSISGDHSPTIDTILHALEYKNKGFEIIVLLQPTSPLRTVNEIDKALEYHQDKNSKSVISVCETEHNIQHINVLPESKNMKNFSKDEIKKKTKEAKEEMANYKPSAKEFVQKNIAQFVHNYSKHRVENRLKS